MIEVGSYCCSLVERPLPSSNTSTVWAAALCFFGLGIGVMNLALRRLSMIFWVGCPASSSSQCRRGYPYGEFRIGWSKNGFDIWGSPVGRWSGIYGLFSHPVASFYGTDLDLAPRICPVLASDPRASQAPADIAKNPVNCRNSGESRSRIVPCAVLWGYNR
jgi:hypothetical protein